jgi:hypothetical protein
MYKRNGQITKLICYPRGKKKAEGKSGERKQHTDKSFENFSAITTFPLPLLLIWYPERRKTRVVESQFSEESVYKREYKKKFVRRYLMS